jgi:hypothetical protein
MKSFLVAAGFSLRWHRLESLCHHLKNFSGQEPGNEKYITPLPLLAVERGSEGGDP